MHETILVGEKKKGGIRKERKRKWAKNWNLSWNFLYFETIKNLFVFIFIPFNFIVSKQEPYGFFISLSFTPLSALPKQDIIKIK